MYYQHCYLPSLLLLFIVFSCLNHFHPSNHHCRQRHRLLLATWQLATATITVDLETLVFAKIKAEQVPFMLNVFRTLIQCLRYNKTPDYLNRQILFKLSLDGKHCCVKLCSPIHMCFPYGWNLRGFNTNIIFTKSSFTKICLQRSQNKICIWLALLKLTFWSKFPGSEWSDVLEFLFLNFWLKDTPLFWARMLFVELRKWTWDTPF